MRAAVDDDHPGTKDGNRATPSAGAIAAALSGMAAAWLAAGSTGLLTHALRHGLTWLALGVAVVVAWPGRAGAKDRWFLVGSLVVAAGMEGALPSVVAGMVSRPVIAVPTSIGYGSSFKGLTALFAMLNSCSSNVAVVNIDNGFGAGYMAGIINRD